MAFYDLFCRCLLRPLTNWLCRIGVGIISGIIMIVAAVLMNNTNISKVHMWSKAALLFTIIGLANGGGFVIGFILGLIGSILGLVYKG